MTKQKTSAIDSLETARAGDGPPSGVYSCEPGWPQDGATVLSVVDRARYEDDPAGLRNCLQWLADRLFLTASTLECNWHDDTKTPEQAPEFARKAEAIASEYRRVVDDLDRMGSSSSALRVARAAGAVMMVLDVIERLETDAAFLLQEEYQRDLGVAG